MDDSRGVVAGVAPLACRIGQDRGTKLVVLVKVRATNSFVDHVGYTHGRAFPTHVHPDFDECANDARVLANRSMAFSAHP